MKKIEVKQWATFNYEQLGLAVSTKSLFMAKLSFFRYITENIITQLHKDNLTGRKRGAARVTSNNKIKT